MDSNKKEKPVASWWVYLLRCVDGSLYTGITTDPERRLAEHNSGRAGARYTRSRQPVEMIYREPAADRASASRREYQIKQLPRDAKIQLVRIPAKMNTDSERT